MFRKELKLGLVAVAVGVLTVIFGMPAASRVPGQDGDFGPPPKRRVHEVWCEHRSTGLG